MENSILGSQKDISLHKCPFSLMCKEKILQQPLKNMAFDFEKRSSSFRFFNTSIHRKFTRGDVRL